MKQGKYGVIMADPPWRYRNNGNGAAKNHYSTMAIADILALPVGELAADDCVLLLWATWPQLTEAMTLCKAWGFEYVTGMPWVKINGAPQRDLFGEMRMKPNYGIGFWFRGCTEPILVCKKGNAKPPERDFVGLISKNFQHSRKPDDLYQYAEAMPGPYLELFARRKREKWDSWGNEIAADIELTAKEGA